MLPALAGLFVLFCAETGRPDDHLDVTYAEHQRLAADSLLLDVAAVPGHGYVAVGERGHVVLSADGTSWTQADVVPTRSTLTTIAHNEGRLWAGGHDSVILTSGDYGRTWTQQFFDPDRQQPIMDLYFSDAQRGLAIGAYGLALYTTDGGRNWQDGLINEEEWHNNALLDLGDGRLMVAGEAGFTYRSSDGGETWETIEMPYPGSMFGIVQGSGEGCVVVFGLRGNVQETCDFGDTWTELTTGTEASIAGAVLDEGVNVFVGSSGLVMTRDDGGPFEVQYHSSGVD
ncbi:MAG: hypothetical protein GWM87_01810, partial [Xanthomonadales bacterium]|nr:hypothetical protein [Xanthomonadales bacterium]NIX11818.1 hypothetical protein [Xanthomonadales bacterium]